MKIRTRITLQFSIIVSIILIAFAFIIYSLLANFRRTEFIDQLKEQAITSVKLLTDIKGVNNKILKEIDKDAFNPILNEKVYIYDTLFNLIFCSLSEDKDEINHQLLNRILTEKEVIIAHNDFELIGIKYTHLNKDYLIVASAYDKYGIPKLNYLRNILIVAVVASLLLIFIVGLFFSRQALNPITKIVLQIDTITATNLNLRLNEGNSKDEISQLAVKFNKMLERLNKAFEVQRGFVANASHELRTPLTALTGNIEVTLMNKELNDVGRMVLTDLLNEIKQLNKLSNGLLDLAQANLDVTEITLTPVRIDELIGQVTADLIKRNKEYTVKLEFEAFPEENQLTLTGNEQLLKSALINLLDNGCKYSPDKTVVVYLSFNSSNITLQIIDKGIGIPTVDLPHIFEPFYRSPLAKKYSGHGIGLTLSKKIIELHKGNIDIQSQLKIGTKITVVLPISC